MANLKELRNRITSIKATQKITRAMQMVSAAKLRRAQEEVEGARPYLKRLNTVIATVMRSPEISSVNDTIMMGGEDGDQSVLLVLITSERGLCGGFNTAIFKKFNTTIATLKEQQKSFKILCVGKKGYELSKRLYGDFIIEYISLASYRNIDFSLAQNVANKIIDLVRSGQCGSCDIYYSQFKSILSQIPVEQRLIPFSYEGGDDTSSDEEASLYCEFEPSVTEIVSSLVPHSFAVNIYSALLENAASEQGARMSAMDSATRNAGEIIDTLTLTYNRTRQAMITKELIEIISGAEALKS